MIFAQTIRFVCSGIFMPEWYAQRHLKWESAHQSSYTQSSTCLCYKLPGAWLLWHGYAKKHFITSSEFTYMCFYMPLLQSCLGGTPFGARSSGPDSCGIGMPKSIWLHHHRSHTCASYMPLLQSCLGALCSGPEVRGPTLVAQVCQKTFDYIIRVHIHVLLHAFATKLPGGTPFGAWSSGPDSCGHRYGIRTRWIETHVCPFCCSGMKRETLSFNHT